LRVKMKFCLAIVLACIALASAGRLPLPKALQDRWHFVMRDDPVDLSRVVGGTQVSSGGRPYQIALLRSGSFTCGGSWISSRTVLSAAHCVDGSENSPALFSIRYNTLTNSGGTTVAVQRIIKHGSYSSSTINNDYALLIIASAFSPGTNAAVIALAAASADPASGATVRVSGFGRTSGGGSVSSVMLYADLTVVARATCNSRWASSNAVTTKMICAHHASRSACNGDSGGPLTIGNTLVGVVSWGPSGCTHATLPTIYASVPAERTWIVNNMV
jgi:trypsin